MSDKILFENYSSLVHSISQKYCYNNKNNIDEVTQEGFVGLIKAINKFDNNKGTKFITYAYICISNEIRKYLKVENRQPKTLNDIMLDSLFASPQSEINEKEEYSLTEEENNIVQLKKSNFNNKEICKALSISQNDIKKKLVKLKQKICS